MVIRRNFWHQKVLAIFVFLGLLLAPVALVSAQVEVLDPACQGVRDANLCQESRRPQQAGNNSIVGRNGILTRAARIISMVAGVGAVIVVIIGGIQYMLSSGDSGGVTNAKNSITYALIGALVAAFSQAIVIFVLNNL